MKMLFVGDGLPEVGLEKDSLQPEVYLKYSVTSWPEMTVSHCSLHGRNIKGLQERLGVGMVSVYYTALMGGHTTGTALLRSELEL